MKPTDYLYEQILAHPSYDTAAEATAMNASNRRTFMVSQASIFVGSEPTDMGRFIGVRYHAGTDTSGVSKGNMVQ